MAKACFLTVLVLYCAMFTKWIIDIDSLRGFVISENGEVYKKPFTSNGKSYGWRKIKKQSKNRWVLNGDYWSENQLREHLILDENPIEIYKTDDLPF